MTTEITDKLADCLDSFFNERGYFTSMVIGEDSVAMSYENNKKNIANIYVIPEANKINVRVRLFGNDDDKPFFEYWGKTSFDGSVESAITKTLMQNVDSHLKAYQNGN